MKTNLIIPLIFFIGVGNIFSQSIGTVTTTFSPAQGLGAEEGIRRGDPSDIIKVGPLYYVWYWKVEVNGKMATWYATSLDGHKWTEMGEAIPTGEKDSWDDEGCFTPGILVTNKKYYLFYTGINNPYKDPDIERSKTRIGIALSYSPDGPWTKLASNPIMEPSRDTTQFDSHRIDDACLIARDGKYWLYYKGRQWGKTYKETKMGVAVASKPEGPFVKYKHNPIIAGGHEVLVWPQGKGVATIIGKEGPKDLINSIMYSKDGYHFIKTNNFSNNVVPYAPGAYRPKAKGKMIEWGLQRAVKNGFQFIERFDLKTETHNLNELQH